MSRLIFSNGSEIAYGPSNTGDEYTGEDVLHDLYTAPSYVVVIERTSDGARRAIDQPYAWDHNSWSWWTTGNMGCDCNRGRLFDHIVSPWNPDDYPCGDVRYRLVEIRFPDGLIVTDIEDRD